MKSDIFRDLRGACLAVLIIATVATGPLQGSMTTSVPSSPGIGRLGRDLLRRVNDEFRLKCAKTFGTGRPGFSW